MAKQEKGFNPTFENGGYWEYYKDLESQFENFLLYVPYLEGNENIYSFRLANLILGIGAYIDSALKEVANDSYFSSKYPLMQNPIYQKGINKGKPRNAVIYDYYPVSDEYQLCDKFVIFKCLPKREAISPFSDFRLEAGKKKVPYWWTTYNKVKHDFSKNFKKAKLKTVRDALAGAFLLTAIHDPSSLRLFNFGLIRPKYPPKAMWETVYDTFKGNEIYPDRPKNVNIFNPFVLETPIFLYDYEKISEKHRIP